jgi:hypothetical protein
MGAAGQTRIEQELGWPHLAKRYLAHFERLTQRSLPAGYTVGASLDDVYKQE